MSSNIVNQIIYNFSLRYCKGVRQLEMYKKIKNILVHDLEIYQ
jgi:hypothetical protein